MFVYSAVEPFQWNGLYISVPNDLGDEPDDTADDACVHQHLKHPGDAVQVTEEDKSGLEHERWTPHDKVEASHAFIPSILHCR